jgi:hypothetical protein
MTSLWFVVSSSIPRIPSQLFCSLCTDVYHKPDNSGSMTTGASRIPTLKATVKGLFNILANLGSERQFSIVPFNGQIAQPRSEVDVHRALESFEYSTGRNASDSLNADILPQLEDRAAGKRLNPTVVVVITDGDVSTPGFILVLPESHGLLRSLFCLLIRRLGRQRPGIW